MRFDSTTLALATTSPEWMGRLSAVSIALAGGRTAPTYLTYLACIGCDGEHTADGPDGWCPECRNIARVEGIHA